MDDEDKTAEVVDDPAKVETVEFPAPGSDPDTRKRLAKMGLAAAETMGDEELRQDAADALDDLYDGDERRKSRAADEERAREHFAGDDQADDGDGKDPAVDETKLKEAADARAASAKDDPDAKAKTPAARTAPAKSTTAKAKE